LDSDRKALALVEEALAEIDRWSMPIARQLAISAYIEHQKLVLAAQVEDFESQWGRYRVTISLLQYTELITNHLQHELDEWQKKSAEPIDPEEVQEMAIRMERQASDRKAARSGP
jgi:hypothetical protein